MKISIVHAKTNCEKTNLLLLFVSGHLNMAAAQLYGTAEDCAILFEMNELCRQQSEREIGDLPVLLWAIGECLQ